MEQQEIVTACDHCGQPYAITELVPVAMTGISSYNGHVLSSTPGGVDVHYGLLDGRCFELLRRVPFGEVVDERDGT